jgi:hypothetical protein
MHAPKTPKIIGEISEKFKFRKSPILIGEKMNNYWGHPQLLRNYPELKEGEEP